MPTYEYRCKHCGHTFEEFQRITADPLKVCPACEQNGLERLIGAGAGIIFKGQGFYTTDYRRSSSGRSAGEESSDRASSKESEESSD